VLDQVRRCLTDRRKRRRILEVIAELDPDERERSYDHTYDYERKRRR